MIKVPLHNSYTWIYLILHLYTNDTHISYLYLLWTHLYWPTTLINTVKLRQAQLDFLFLIYGILTKMGTLEELSNTVAELQQSLTPQWCDYTQYCSLHAEWQRRCMGAGWCVRGSVIFTGGWWRQGHGSSWKKIFLHIYFNTSGKNFA